MDRSKTVIGFGKRTKIVLAVLLVVLAVTIPAVLVVQNAVPFLTIAEAQSYGPGDTIAVKGKLVANSYVQSADAQVATFHISDENGTDNSRLPISYSGEIGNLFFNEHSVFNVTGTLDEGGVLQAEMLSVKCPTKYQTDAENNQDLYDQRYPSDPVQG